MFGDHPLPLILWLVQTDQQVQEAKLVADFEVAIRQAAPALAEEAGRFMIAAIEWTFAALILVPLTAIALGFLLRRIALRRWAG